MAFHATFTLFSGSRARWIDCKLVSKVSMGAAVLSTSRELSLEEMKKEQRQTLEAIGLDSREVLSLLLLMQKLMIVQVTALEPGWLQNKENSNLLQLL